MRLDTLLKTDTCSWKTILADQVLEVRVRKGHVHFIRRHRLEAPEDERSFESV